MRIFNSIVTTILFLPVIVLATTIPQLSLDELYEEADIVAIVEVDSGETIEGDTIPCGAKYVAKVVTGIKNSTKGEKVEFGYHLGQRIGSEYLVFLNKKEAVFSPLSSTNPSSQNIAAKFAAECGKRHPNLIIMHSGFGSIEIEWPFETNHKNALLLNATYIIPPPNLELTSTEPSRCNNTKECYWVTKQNIIDYFTAKNGKKP